ncbi:hypothetical protein EVAR_53075_1 [Eumeta japonica]|uniref:Uncharacterized protein n=1 Tax=Eumeta variegata TaxID=151549 RepID=A0A4C1YX24_EUMVA|nr:hypothetical protein EVAR_53075_1 [Eumeta japonica]
MVITPGAFRTPASLKVPTRVVTFVTPYAEEIRTDHPESHAPTASVCRSVASDELTTALADSRSHHHVIRGFGPYVTIALPVRSPPQRFHLRSRSLRWRNGREWPTTVIIDTTTAPRTDNRYALRDTNINLGRRAFRARAGPAVWGWRCRADLRIDTRPIWIRLSLEERILNMYHNYSTQFGEKASPLGASSGRKRQRLTLAQITWRMQSPHYEASFCELPFEMYVNENHGNFCANDVTDEPPRDGILPRAAALARAPTPHHRP